MVELLQDRSLVIAVGFPVGFAAILCLAYLSDHGEELLHTLRRLRRVPPSPAPLPPPAPEVPPWLASGRATSLRHAADAQRAGVACAARGVPRLRLGRSCGWVTRRPGETRLPFDERWSVLVTEPDLPGQARLLAALAYHRPALERLLPQGGRRCLELGQGELVLVRPPRAIPLASRAWTYEQLDSIARAIELACGVGAPVVVALRGEATRCAFCHDALDASARRCDGCGTRLHAECRDELAGCPTAGCGRAA